MTGSVFGYATKKGKRWGYVYPLPDGRQRRRGGFARKQDAAQALTAALWESRQNASLPPAYTVAQWIAREIDRKAPGLSPVTASNYRRQLRDYVAGRELGQLPLAQVDQTAVARWVAGLAFKSPVSVATIWQVVALHLAPLVRRGDLPRDTLDVVLPRRPDTPLRIWTPDQVRRVLDTMDHWVGTPLLVAVTTGLRVGELLALRWDDYRDGALDVHRSLAWIDGKPQEKDPKVKRSRRRVDLYPDTIAALEGHRARQRERQSELPSWETEGRIFPAHRGGPWRAQALAYQFQRRIAKIDVPRVRWHDLRHTHASHLVAAGVDPATVAKRLGDTIETVLRTYAHAIPGGQIAAIEKGATYLNLSRPRAEIVPFPKSHDMR